MPLIRAAMAVLAVLLIAEHPAAADDEPARDEEPVGTAPEREENYRARLSTTAVYYTEAASEVVDGNDQASPNDLLFSDLRGRIEAQNAGGGHWGGLADFRLRLTTDDLSARGYVGGPEYQLREAYGARDGERTRVAVGRQLIREVDATRVDGVSLLHRITQRWDVGGFAGLYPNPLSRSLDDDYRSGTEALGMPAAAGVWTAYRGERGWGSLGAGAVTPRDDATGEREPTRAFVASSGYLRAGDSLDLFHYSAADLAGAGGVQLLNAQLGASWRATTRVRLELAYAHMSTYALEVYVRDLLETADPEAEAGAPVQNNLTVLRIGSDEGRAGVNVSLPARVNAHGELRLRRREALVDADLPMEIAGLGADRQIDATAGVNQRRSLLGLDLGARVVAIRGDRTSSEFVTGRARRSWLAGRLAIELETSYIAYADQCDPDAGDPTCSGSVDGTTVRGGGMILLAPDRHWLVLTDYRSAYNRAERAGERQPSIISHAVFARAQYTF